MAELGGVSDAWRRAAEANMRYYQAWGRLAKEWLDEIVGVGRDVAVAAALKADTTSPVMMRTSAPPAPSSAASATATPNGPTLVLEAAGGNEASGAFLVENNLGHPVDATVLADPIPGPDDNGADRVTLRFDPPRVSLAPQERVVVKALAVVPTTLPEGVDQRTVIRVPDLPGTSIPVVIRRTADPMDEG